MFYSYATFLTIGALEVQSLSHVLGILTVGNIRLAVFTVLGLMVFTLLFGNVLIPIKELHYSLQVLNNFASIKLLFESLMILFYGLDRCSDREFSYTLAILDIEDLDLYKNLYLLIAQFFIFRAIALFVLIRKLNPIMNTKKDHDKRSKLIQKITRLGSKTKIASNLYL